MAQHIEYNQPYYSPIHIITSSQLKY